MEREAALIKPARDYWAAVERVRVASGVEAAQSKKAKALAALQAIIGQIMPYEERTITGLIIKAQAMQAWGQVDTIAKHLTPESWTWADDMAATIIRQASA